MTRGVMINISCIILALPSSRMSHQLMKPVSIGKFQFMYMYTFMHCAIYDQSCIKGISFQPIYMFDI